MGTWVRACRAAAVVVIGACLVPVRPVLAANWEDAAWSAWTPAGAVTSTAAAASWGAGRMDVFARGQDNALYHRWWGGGASWSGWESLGGTVESSPVAASWGPNRLDVFALGPNDVLAHRWWDGTAWGGWESLGGTLTSTPAVASWGPNHLDLFARGTDRAMWHRGWNGSSWSDWESLGGMLASAPTAVSWGPNRVDVLVRGTDNALWHRRWDGTAWSWWESLGGALTSAPAVASWGAGRLDVFLRGTDNGLWHRWWDGTAWSGWESRGGVLNGDPQAYSWEPNRIDVLIRGTDNGLWRADWNGAGWTGWASLGAAPDQIVMPDVPYYRQQYELSCEEAAIQMALGHDFISTSQLQELNDIGIDWRAAYTTSDGVLHWGDPYTNFVGDPNGSEVQLTGYGTFFPTISRIGSSYGANVLRASEGVSPQDVYHALLGGHPVVVWVSFDWQFHQHGQWLAFDGRWVQYEGPVEHAVTLVGVNQSSVYVFNPWFGPQWIDKATFEAAYATYNDMAVFVE